ncbi:MAG: dihydrolipoyl dehydrogenase [Clostridia bacterium]
MGELTVADVKNHKYQLTILGAGPGGYTAAIRAGQLGVDVLLVEGEYIGGTCLNWGCIPTKAIYRSAEVLEDIGDADELGLKVAEVGADFPAIMRRKDEVVTGLRSNVSKLLEQNGVDILAGHGYLAEDGALRVSTPDGEAEIDTERLLLAVGSVPSKPPIPGLDLPNVMDSRGLLSLEELPESMVVIGGGIIGMEFASIFAALGCDVTVLEMLPTLLPTIEDELARRMNPVLRKRGITAYTKATVKSVEQSGDGLAVNYERKEKAGRLETDLVLVATGRAPNTRDLPLDALGIEHERGAIKVDEAMVTSNPRFLAIGDAVARMMLAHVASSEALVAVENAFGGGRDPVNYRAVPSVVFTLPPAASVGLSESDAREEYSEVQVAKFPFGALGKAVSRGRIDGLVKMVSDGSSGEILGLHVFGDGAADLVHEGALAIQHGLTVRDLAHTVHAHPTLSEAVMEAAHVGVGAPIHVVKR